MKHKVYLKQARPTKAGGFFFYVSTSAGNQTCGAQQADGTMRYSRVQDSTPRKWGFINPCDSEGNALPITDIAVQELLVRCTEALAYNKFTGQMETVFNGDSQPVTNWLLDDTAPITKAGVATGGYWCCVNTAPQLPAVTAESTLPQLRAHASANGVVIPASVKLKEDVVAFLRSKGLLA